MQDLAALFEAAPAAAATARCVAARIPRATIRRAANSSARPPVVHPAPGLAATAPIANLQTVSAHPSPDGHPKSALSRRGLSTNLPDLTTRAAQRAIVRRVGTAARAPANALQAESSDRVPVVPATAQAAASFRQRSLEPESLAQENPAQGISALTSHGLRVQETVRSARAAKKHPAVRVAHGLTAQVKRATRKSVPSSATKPAKRAAQQSNDRLPHGNKGGWKPKPSSGSFSKSGKPAFGKPKFGEARPGGAKYGGQKSA